MCNLLREWLSDPEGDEFMLSSKWLDNSIGAEEVITEYGQQHPLPIRAHEEGSLRPACSTGPVSCASNVNLIAIQT